MKINLVRSLATVAILSLTGCLSHTTQHFNTGIILEPGEQVDMLAIAYADAYICNGEMVRNQSKFQRCVQDTSYFDADYGYAHYEKVTMPHGSSIWRLGIRKDWGPFTGVDIGWQMEFPGTLDFDARFGLPRPDSVLWHHSISAGWGIGNWADNSWFLEYAWSYPITANTLFYASFRETYLATQFLDLRITDNNRDDDLFGHSRRFLHQASTGLRLGRFGGAFFVPDYFHFNLYTGYPNLMMFGPVADQVMLDQGYPPVDIIFSVGLEWRE